ncbi:MAG TPA: MoaD/ThiS family protein [Acidimicrobiales bacterium]|nr:MoaD/ThiS family protein [Acidimicrobiales bacterium]
MTHSATNGDPAGPRGAPGAGPSDAGDRTGAPPVRLLLFAAAREAAGTRSAEMTGATVGDVLGEARRRFGPAFGAVLDGSRVWVNGQPADPADPLGPGDEVAVLPPVSGG